MADKQHEPESAIGIVVASHEDMGLVDPGVRLLEKLACPYTLHVLPAWAIPQNQAEIARNMAAIKVAIVAAGSEPFLPALIASLTSLPVIAVPMARDAAALQMLMRASAAAPLAAVEPGGAQQAALLAIRIMATADSRWARYLREHRRLMMLEYSELDRELLGTEAGAAEPDDPPRRPAPKPTAVKPVPHAPRPPAPAPTDEEYVESEEGPVVVRPVDLERPLPAAQPAPPPAPAEPATPPPARKMGLRRIDSDAPDPGLIEAAVDCLLEGGIVAFPTDTVYGVAADATNPAAVNALYDLKGRSRTKAIVLMVDSPRLLSGIACNLTVEMRRLMEAFWPGPLTIIFQKRPGNFMHVSSKDTIGVRLPDHSVPLAIMQALSRPLACTSANLSGEPEAHGAETIEATFGDQINLILDGGPLPSSPPSTVIDVTGEPYRVLRQGALGYAQLAAIVGDKLEAEKE